MLLAHGADADISNSTGQTAADMAEQNNHKQLGDILWLQQKASQIFEAIRKGDATQVKTLLQNKPELATGKNNHKTPPLHWAVTQNGSKEIIEALLDAKAEVNARDDDGHTPLHCAAATGKIEIVQLLLTHQADVNATDSYGSKPLHYAAEKGSKDIVELLLNNKADVNAANNDGETPLKMAKNRKDIADILRQHGAKE